MFIHSYTHTVCNISFFHFLTLLPTEVILNFDCNKEGLSDQVIRQN